MADTYTRIEDIERDLALAMDEIDADDYFDQVAVLRRAYNINIKEDEYKSIVKMALTELLEGNKEIITSRDTLLEGENRAKFLAADLAVMELMADGKAAHTLELATLPLMDRFVIFAMGAVYMRVLDRLGLTIYK